jgi:hypothetical protein
MQADQTAHYDQATADDTDDSLFATDIAFEHDNPLVCELTGCHARMIPYRHG